MTFLELAQERYSVRAYSDKPVEQELVALGYDSLSKLRDADPDELYTRACLLQNEQLDKCVLYAFHCAVAYARDPEPNPSQYRWWYFTDDKEKERKAK